MAKSFNPGAFRHKIEFLNPPADKNEHGELTGEGSLFKKVMASIEPLLGKELYTAMTAGTKIEVKFRTRYTPGVKDTMYIRRGEELYEIISLVDADFAHKELLCYCRMVK